MRLDDFLFADDTEWFRSLSTSKKTLIKALMAHWTKKVPDDLYIFWRNGGVVSHEMRADAKRYTSFRTKIWRYRKMFNESDQGLSAVEAILDSNEADATSVYGAIFDKDPLMKYMIVRFPRSTDICKLDKQRVIQIIKLLKPLTRSYVNEYIRNEIKPKEFEALREIATHPKSEHHDIVISALKGVTL